MMANIHHSLAHMCECSDWFWRDQAHYWMWFKLCLLSQKLFTMGLSNHESPFQHWFLEGFYGSLEMQSLEEIQLHANLLWTFFKRCSESFLGYQSQQSTLIFTIFCQQMDFQYLRLERCNRWNQLIDECTKHFVAHFSYLGHLESRRFSISHFELASKRAELLRLESRLHRVDSDRARCVDLNVQLL